MGRCWTVSMVFLTFQTLTTSGIKQILTFMTVHKTWNEASLVCNMKGGYLYKDGSAAVTAEVEALAVMEPWASQGYLNDDFWIGLGYSGTLDTGGDPIYTWNSDCTLMDNANDYSDWHPSEPKFPTSRECIYRKRAGDNWYTSPCSAYKYYICQQEVADPCNKVLVNNKRGAGVGDELYLTVTLTACDMHCTNAKCVAYAYSSTTQRCYIYINYGILHFEDPSNLQSDSGYVLYLMGCFEAAVDATIYNVTNGNSGVDVQCAALTETTTSPTTQVLTNLSILSANLCSCQCIQYSTGYEEDILKKVSILHSKLAVNKAGLSSTKRRLTCANDSRTTSACIGVLASLFLVLCISVVIAADLQSICRSGRKNRL